MDLLSSSFGQLPTNFSNPFTSIANKWMPTSMTEVFRLCEWMYRYNGIYRGAIERAARLFVTEFKYDEAETTNSLTAIKKFLEKDVNFKTTLISIGIDYLNYGNTFLVLYLPFKRSLRCSKCNNTYLADEVELEFNTDGEFNGPCPGKCGNVTFAYRDIPIKDMSKINIVRIPPGEIEIIYNRVSGNRTYIWNMPFDQKAKYINGKGTILIKETPTDILECVYHDKKIEFKEGDLLHIAQPNLAGNNIEWGMPFAISCFPLIFYISVLRKANEAISMDYIVPLRVLFPQSATSNQEAAFMTLSNFVSRLKEIVRHHRLDPADWNIAPSPVGYQIIGGEKRSLMISDDIKLSNEELLNSMGFPPELYYGTLQLQSTPMALRLLDNTFGLSDIYNRVIDWTLQKACAYTNTDYTRASLSPIKWIDDIERRQMVIQLSSADKISDITLLEQYGLDYQREQERKIEQMQILKDVQARADKQQQRQQQTDPQSGGQSGMPGTPQAIMEQAQSMAEQFVNMPPDQRELELKRLAQQNQLLHHAVKGIIDQIINRMRTDGKNMLLQQQQNNPQTPIQ